MAGLNAIRHVRVSHDSDLKHEFNIHEKIGQGSFGVVYLISDIATRKKWAMKKVHKEKAGTTALKMLLREVDILKRVCHPNIIRMEAVYETKRKMYFVLEFCDLGDCGKLSKRHPNGLPESETKCIVNQLTSAIFYLHKQDIVHRDLKLENILLSSNKDSAIGFIVKVTDFGLSVVKENRDHSLHAVCGTPMYMPPEIVNNQTYSKLCDTWSIGIITYFLLCGRPPFYSSKQDELYEQIRKSEVKFSHSSWDAVSDTAKHLICGMLAQDPAHRLTTGEILDNGWFTGIDDSKGQHSNVLTLMKEYRNHPVIVEIDDQPMPLTREVTIDAILADSRKFNTPSPFAVSEEDEENVEAQLEAENSNSTTLTDYMKESAKETSKKDEDKVYLKYKNQLSKTPHYMNSTSASLSRENTLPKISKQSYSLK